MSDPPPKGPVKKAITGEGYARRILSGKSLGKIQGNAFPVKSLIGKLCTKGTRHCLFHILLSFKDRQSLPSPCSHGPDACRDWDQQRWETSGQKLDPALTTISCSLGALTKNKCLLAAPNPPH